MAAAAVLLAVLGAASCSDDDDGGDGTDSAAEQTTTTAAEEEPVGPERPDGPAATFVELEGGNGLFLATAGGGPDLQEAGWTETEYAAGGTATSYTATTSEPAQGLLELAPAEEADFSTRVIVRRPADGADFNGTVVVEWLNVSSGADAAPDYTYMAEELVRGGYTWVGVSAQRIGIEGGPVAVGVPGGEGLGLGAGLRAIDPDRYGDLAHPGDAFAYDIYTQVARALREPGELDPLEGLQVERVLAVGESQSAFTLTTYVNGVQPLTGMFDGFLIHSRGGGAAPLGEPGEGIDVAGSIGTETTTIRTDGEAPVLVVQTEGDVVGLLNFLPARQDDTDRFRLWEIAGAAHADVFQAGEVEELLGCATPINRGQQVFVLRAGLRHLDTWAQGGDAPAEAPRLDTDDAGAYLVDEVGNVTGGVRSPVVDAPVDRLSGAAPEGSSIVCLLMGATIALTDEQLSTLYESADDYLAQYEAATDAMIDGGFALEDDRDEILEGASPERIP